MHLCSMGHERGAPVKHVSDSRPSPPDPRELLLRKTLLAILAIALIVAMGLVFFVQPNRKSRISDFELCQKRCTTEGKFAKLIPKEGPLPAKPLPRERECVCY